MRAIRNTAVEGSVTVGEGSSESLTLGRRLKTARLNRKKSLEEVAHSTKIMKTYLSALEEDRYEALPAETFVRGFIRSYALEVGLDPDDLIAEYRQFLAEKTQPALLITPTATMTKSRQRDWRLASAILMVAAFLLAAVGLYLLNDLMEQRRVEPAAVNVPITDPVDAVDPIATFETGPTDLSSTPPLIPEAEGVAPPAAVPGPDAAAPAPAPKPSAPAGRASELVMRSKGAAEIKIKKDGEPTQTVQLTAGESRTLLVYRSAEISIDRPDQVDLKFNGRRIQAPEEGAGPVMLFNLER